MQLIANKFLNDLCILFNFSMDSENPFVLILTGLPYFMDKTCFKPEPVPGPKGGFDPFK